jgi:hypothetical protein
MDSYCFAPCFLNYFSMLITIDLTKGSGSRRLKNMWIRYIRIRMHYTRVWLRVRATQFGQKLIFSLSHTGSRNNFPIRPDPNSTMWKFTYLTNFRRKWGSWLCPFVTFFRVLVPTSTTAVALQQVEVLPQFAHLLITKIKLNFTTDKSPTMNYKNLLSDLS